jgi:hypothetical protein
VSDNSLYRDCGDDRSIRYFAVKRCAYGARRVPRLRRVKATDLFFDLAIADQSRLHTARRTGGAPPSPLKLPERRTRPWRMTRNDVKRCATMPVLQARRRDAPTPSSRARGGSRGGKRDRSRKISVPSLKVFAACQSLPKSLNHQANRLWAGSVK